MHRHPRTQNQRGDSNAALSYSSENSPPPVSGPRGTERTERRPRPRLPLRTLQSFPLKSLQVSLYPLFRSSLIMNGHRGADGAREESRNIRPGERETPPISSRPAGEIGWRRRPHRHLRRGDRR
ncbi:hypothetical protein SKAU_G00318590 [Synaphobranchus kaupii]|uniref:Uncharacterized protein n=1 Tax=Synaphobranchus kaupii TaxID=118154 RepID=A0A9Q1IM30_SYNKA|nr:hypothetical protein SKAU_G00318590 [Synaphobranchus kaupii]